MVTEEVEDIYEQMNELMDEEKGNNYVVVMGDCIGEVRQEMTKRLGNLGLSNVMTEKKG